MRSVCDRRGAATRNCPGNCNRTRRRSGKPGCELPAEAKADITGLFLVRYLFDSKQLPGGEAAERRLYTTFLASSFRTMRFGLKEAHGRGMALQFNYLTDKGAFVARPETTRGRKRCSTNWVGLARRWKGLWQGCGICRPISTRASRLSRRYPARGPELCRPGALVWYMMTPKGGFRDESTGVPDGVGGRGECGL
jgi:hypothetical protein